MEHLLLHKELLLSGLLLLVLLVWEVILERSLAKNLTSRLGRLIEGCRMDLLLVRLVKRFRVGILILCLGMHCRHVGGIGWHFSASVLTWLYILELRRVFVIV